MANEFIIKKGLISKANSIVSGSLIVTEGVSGSFSGSFVGNGSQLSGIIPPSGRFGIADVSGSYTYYSNLSSSLAAAAAGDTIQLFTNHTEASDHTFHLKDKVDFNFNGKELFIIASATLDATDMITDNNIAVSCSFYNGKIRFTQSTSAGIFNRLLYIDNVASEITSIGFEWEVENGTNATPFYPIRNDGTLNGGKFIGGPNIFNYLIQTYGQLKNLDVYASKGIRFNGYLKKHYNLKVHTYGGQAGAEVSQNYLYNSYFHAETGQALSIYYAINCDIRADAGAGVTGVRRLIDSSVVNTDGIGVTLSGEMIGGSVYTNNNVSVAAGNNEVLGVTIYNKDYLGPGVTISNGEISNCAIIDDYPFNGQKSIQVDSGATSPTITNCSFDFLNNNNTNIAITAVDDDTPVFFANNTFKNCTPTNPTKVTQAIINVPDQQGNITISSSLDNNRTYSGSFSGSYVGDGSGLTNLQRPISSSVSTDITASNLNAGYYFRAGGNVTCSIQSSSLVSCNVGSEFEFFQTSSAGNLLFLTGSGVTLNSKNGNITLTGQFSAATLKKVDNDEWDLIGDLS
jgi:hypothetical protein